MPKPSLAQYTVEDLEEYIKARRIIAQYESEPSKGGAVEKAPKAKAKGTRGKNSAPINPADVIAAIKKAGGDGISGAKLQEAIGTNFNKFTKWFKEHGKANNVHKEPAKKGPGFLYTVKS